jgi:hypothetical protein
MRIFVAWLTYPVPGWEVDPSGDSMNVDMGTKTISDTQSYRGTGTDAAIPGITGILIHSVNDEGSMRRGTANAVVDTFLLIVFVPSLISALVLFIVLPSGGGRDGGTFLSVQRSTWATVHDYAGLLFIALLVLHLVLHYRYLRHLNRHLAMPSGVQEE